jgi:TetR/AcrR family transcriptional regulator
MPVARLTGQERRAAIIDAAINCFAQNGFRGVTTRELAQSAGVSEPVLYDHFPSKRDLYNAIIEKIATDSQESFANWPGNLPAGSDDREFFTALGASILDWHERNPSYVRLLMFSALEGHEFGEIFFERHSEQFCHALAGHIRERIEAGALRDVDPMLATQHFIGVVMHFGIHCSISRKGAECAPREAVLPTMVDIFLKGIQA